MDCLSTINPAKLINSIAKLTGLSLEETAEAFTTTSEREGGDGKRESERVREWQIETTKQLSSCAGKGSECGACFR